MIDYTKWSSRQAASTIEVSQDAGLRAYMQGIYNYMAMALTLTGVIAYLVGTSPQLLSLFYTVSSQGNVTGMSGLGWLVTFLPIGFVMALSFGFNRLSLQATQMIFWAYAAVMGVSLSSIFLLFTGESIARVFFITAGVFGGMSIYGHTTKRDLTSFGSFLVMGLFGIILASLVNIFLHSSGMDFAISLLSIFIFVGLTAYDTQQIRSMYYYVGGADQALIGKLSVQGALRLYLDFINIFLQLLRFFGDRRN